jgi:hypothetical protein
MWREERRVEERERERGSSFLSKDMFLMFGKLVFISELPLLKDYCWTIF